MPELPDLQVFSQNLDKKLAKKKLKTINVLSAKKLNVQVKALKATLEGQTLKKVYREGKEIYLEFGKGNILALHLMLHGKLYFFDERNMQKYTIIELLFEDNTGLAMTDFQGMATPALDPETKPAPDALDLNLPYLKEKLQKTRSAIKNVLLDQKIIRGIGNAYADEILWDARIAPSSVSNKIPVKNMEILFKSIRSVLLDAEKQIRKSDPDIIAGEVRGFLKIHNAKKEKSPSGAVIHVTGSGRKTYFTDEQAEFK